MEFNRSISYGLNKSVVKTLLYFYNLADCGQI